MSMLPAKTEQIEIVVNGLRRRVPAGMALPELLRFLQIDPARVAVEMNKAIVRRPAWDETLVPDDATLEIVQFVGGG